ncbi:hypothetical protein GA830_01550 [Mesorhizobium sp. NBSH29]|uniref:hypothetical protein n=1 Tax=Mesorhizobium sp. NBSH29 TaxID=2654249 RepID=UPI00189676A7|nr:hypothetical protein [Mesorhizobium sp. NBSH29]QPC85569.1 hypothetical protein GA830_01550 [Mesorhizobium sp. NBSH29]
MTDKTSDARARAELKFRKTEREASARDIIMAEQSAEAEKRKAKTSMLKELRLSREEAELAEQGAAPAKKKRVKA